MPLFFFHLSTPSELIVDDEGVELSDIEEARKTATESAREIISETLADGGHVGGFAFKVTNDRGQQVAVLAFAPLLNGAHGNEPQ